MGRIPMFVAVLLALVAGTIVHAGNKPAYPNLVQGSPELVEELAKKNRTVVVLFTAGFCGQCPPMKAAANKLAGDTQLVVVLIDTEQYPQYTAMHGVSGIPHVMRLRYGKPSGTLVGVWPTEAFGKFVLTGSP